MSGVHDGVVVGRATVRVDRRARRPRAGALPAAVTPWLLAVAAAAQAPGELDFDPGQLSVVTIAPNGATHVIASPVSYVGQNLLLDAPLTIAAGGELRLERCSLRVRGDVLLQDGARLTVIDSDFLLPNGYQQEHELRIEGGLLHTERATFGSGYVGGNLAQTRLLHLRGTWLARHTVVQGLVTILSDGRGGWFGDPRWKGGSVFARGLFEGDRADAIQMSGMGDGVFVDGTMNVGLYYDAGVAVPASATIDLDGRSSLGLVYGDPSVHAGVTNPLVGSACRIELANHRSPTWQFFAVNASTAGPLQTLTLRNAEDILCNLRGVDLAGAPVLAGPWSSHYAQLPGLPSTGRPGFHAMPPGCSVRLGNVQFQSGPGANDWNRIRGWGLYARGAGTNLTVSGPTNLAELQLTDGQMHLAGAGSFDMGVFANTVRLYQSASLTITNGKLGEVAVSPGVVGLIEANDQSTCAITTARTGPLRLRVTSPTASITAQNVFGVGNLVLDNAGGGVLQVAQASATQATDLQNLGFESPLLAGGVAPNWSVAGGAGTLVADAAPGAPGVSSYAFASTAGAASVGKSLSLPPETSVSLVGAAKVVAAPATGAPTWRASQGGNVQSRAIATTANVWQRGLTPLLTTAGTAPVALQFLAGGASGTTRLDDVRVAVGSWWDADNLANLGFEGACRWPGDAPLWQPAPDAWRNFRVACAVDAAAVRPGAAAGSRSLRASLSSTLGNVWKELTWLRAGDVVAVSGWARGTGGGSANQQVIVGNGPTFFVVAPPNVFSGPLPCDGAWRQFNLTYTVPPNPSFTRIDLGCFGQPGNDFWFDDLTVTIQ
jgi:hypothetical protein